MNEGLLAYITRVIYITIVSSWMLQHCNTVGKKNHSLIFFFCQEGDIVTVCSLKKPQKGKKSSKHKPFGSFDLLAAEINNCRA